MADESTKIEKCCDSELIRFYRKLPPRESNTFVLFNHRSFHSVHGTDAEFVSRNFLNTSKSLRLIGDDEDDDNDDDDGDESGEEKLQTVYISQPRFPSLLRFFLVDNNFCVRIYCRSNSKSSTSKDWKLECEASPGCLGTLENIIYGDDFTASIQVAAIYVTENHKVFVAALDTVGCVISLASFQDNAFYLQLETILVQINPKECMVPEEAIKLQQLLKKHSIWVNKYRPFDISVAGISDQIHQVLAGLCLPHCLKSMENILYQCGPDILIPIHHLLQKQKLFLTPMDTDDGPSEYPFKCFYLRRLNLDEQLRLDLPSITHLHLFPEANNNKELRSLFQLLNKCKTASGSKTLELFIRQPTVNLRTIENRLNIVEFFVKNGFVANKIHDYYLPNLPDITRLYKKLNTERSTVKDLLNLYFLLEKLGELKEFLNDSNIEFPAEFENLINRKLNKLLDDTRSMFNRLSESIDFDHFNEENEAKLNAETFPELQTLNEQLKECKKPMKREHGLIQKKYPTANVLFEYEKDRGWFFRVTKKFNSEIELDQKNCILLSDFKKDKDLKFTTKKLQDLSKEYFEVQREFEEEQKKCLKKLLDELRDDLYQVIVMENFVAYLDVMLAFAKTVYDSPLGYCKPSVLPKDQNIIELIQFRHPVLEVIKNNDFVANNIKFDENLKFFVITGPNMGGKTTLMRSVALCVLMAQIGCFVPCQSAKISLVDAIFTRLNSSDNPLVGLSTFMAEMKETAAILKSATCHSMVLIDELGRSTSITDGFGIAKAVTEHIANDLKSYAMFATHFHTLGTDIPSMARLYMKASFDADCLVNHYVAERLLEDQNQEQPNQENGGNSFGIEVLKSVRMPERIIEDAKRRLEIILEEEDIGSEKNKAILLELVNRVQAYDPGQDEDQMRQQFAKDLYDQLSRQLN